MAFHPFQSFRKHQKGLLAVTTIFVMFIFILSYSSGGADPITRLMGIFGQGRGKDKAEVTTLYGKKVTVSDLDELKSHRRWANTFMQKAVFSGGPRLSDNDQKVVDDRMQDIQKKAQQESQAEMMRQLQQGHFDMDFQQRSQTLTAEIQKRLIREYYRELLGENKADAARYVIRPVQLRDLFTWMSSHPTEVYFGSGLSGEDLLDFKIWLQQADRLNISLTDEDVRREVNREADSEILTADATKNDAQVRLFLGAGLGKTVDPKDVYTALRDEFRVRLAREVVLGGTPGARAGFATPLANDRAMIGSTPADFWDFYKDNRTELKVHFLRVPVEPFLAQVNEDIKGHKLKMPSEYVLQQLFDKYSTTEPSPDRAEPAFKVPRRVKVVWIAVDPTSEYYRKAAKEALPEKVVPYLSLADALTLATAAPAFGGLPCGAAGWLATATASVSDPVQLEYGKYISGTKSAWDAPPANSSNPYPINEKRPEAIAAFVGLVGQAGGQAATLGPWQGIDAGLGAVVAVQQKEVSDRDAAMVLAAANPFPLAVVTQEAALAHVKLPSFTDVSSDMVQSVYNELTKQLADATLEKFKKDLEAKRTNTDDVKKYIEENANPAHGITNYGAMDKPMSEWDIAKDSALEPLRKAYAGRTPLTPQSLQAFAARFFDMKPDPRFRDFKPTAKELYQPESLITQGDTQYEFWLTQKDSPTTPKFKDKDVRTQVEEAWKLEKARELAQKKAEEIVQQLKKRGDGVRPEKFLEDEAARLKQDLNLKPTAGMEEKPLTHTKTISKLVDKPNVMRADAGRHYEPFALTDLGIEYPPTTTVEDLFKALHNAGDATILKDRPDRNEYVAVLLDKPIVPSKDQFKEVYQKASAPIFRDPLWEDFMAKRAQDYRNDAMRQLREQSGAPLEDGDYKIDPEVRRRLRSDSRGGDDE